MLDTDAVFYQELCYPFHITVHMNELLECKEK